MKKFNKVISFLIFNSFYFFHFVNLNAQTLIGLQSGIHYHYLNNATDKHPEPFLIEQKMAPGFSLGLFLSQRFKGLELYISPNYALFNSKFLGYDSDTSNISLALNKIRFQSINIPLHLCYHFIHTSSFHPYIGAGFNYARLLTYKDEYFTLNADGSINPDEQHYYIEKNYSFGETKITSRVSEILFDQWIYKKSYLSLLGTLGIEGNLGLNKKIRLQLQYCQSLDDIENKVLFTQSFKNLPPSPANSYKEYYWDSGKYTRLFPSAYYNGSNLKPRTKTIAQNFSFQLGLSFNLSKKSNKNF